MRSMSYRRVKPLVEDVVGALAVDSPLPAPMPAVACRPPARGFTLIELMVTVAVAAILLMVAVPSFKNMMLSNRLTAAANEMVGSINTARMEAIKRNTTTLVCGDGSVYVGACGGTGTKVRAPITGIDTPLQLTGFVGISFSAQGLAHKTGGSGLYGGIVADICTSSLSDNNHRVIRMVGGSIVTTTPAPGSCP